MFTRNVERLARGNMFRTFLGLTRTSLLRGIPPVLLLELQKPCKMGQRMFCAPAWYKPLGNVPRPSKVNPKPQSSEMVPLESLMDPKSLACMEKLHDACTSREIYQALGEHSECLNEIHVARALSRLAAIHSSDSPEGVMMTSPVSEATNLVRTGSVVVRQDSEFVHLCRLALQHSRLMDSKVFLDVLEAVVNLGVPQSSALVQTFLAGAEQRLNRFDGDDLARLASRLVRLQEQADSRVQALLQAVSLLVSDKIKTCFDAEPLVSLLYSVGKRLDRHGSIQLAWRLIAILQTKEGIATEKEQTVVDTAEAVVVFHLIGYRNEQFLRAASGILLNGLEHLSPNKFMMTLHSMSGLRYYNSQFLEKVGDIIADRVEEYKIHHLSTILLAYASQRYLHENLFDAVAASVVGRVSLGNDCLGELVGILTPFTVLRHGPLPCDSLAAKLVDRIADLAERQLGTAQGSQFDDGLLVTLAAILSQCGSFPPKIIKAAIHKNCYEPLLGDPKMVQHLRALCNAITFDGPDDRPSRAVSAEKLLPTSHLGELSDALDLIDRERTDATERDRQDPFRASVTESLVDVTSNSRWSVTTDPPRRSGYTTDFVVSDRMNEKPPIAVCLTKHEQYLANFPGKVLAGEAVKQRHLEAMGYTIHKIRKMDWMGLQSADERKRCMQRILGLRPSLSA